MRFQRHTSQICHLPSYSNLGNKSVFTLCDGSERASLQLGQENRNDPDGKICGNQVIKTHTRIDHVSKLVLHLIFWLANVSTLACCHQSRSYTERVNKQNHRNGQYYLCILHCEWYADWNATLY